MVHFFVLISMLWACTYADTMSKTGFISSTEHFIKQQETALGIPVGLLHAVACTESGRKVNGRFQPHPWTINVHGKGYVYSSKLEAIKAVRDFRSKGYTSIDVGPMQINLKHHPHAFPNLHAAFDPQLNVAYGAKYLTSLLIKFGDWQTAIGHYHSSTPSKSYGYSQKVVSKWKKLAHSTNGKWQNLLNTSPQRKPQYVIDKQTQVANSKAYRNDLYALQLAHHQVRASSRPMKVKMMTIGATSPIMDQSKFIPLKQQRSVNQIKGTHRRFIPLS